MSQVASVLGGERVTCADAPVGEGVSCAALLVEEVTCCSRYDRSDWESTTVVADCARASASNLRVDEGVSEIPSSRMLVMLSL